MSAGEVDPRLRLRSLEDPEVMRGFTRNLREGIYITNGRGELLDANPAFCEMFGARTLDEMRAFNAADLVADPEQRRREHELLARDGAVHEFELQIRRLDGEVRTVLDTTFVVHAPDTGEVLYHGMLVDITARKQLQEQLLELSIRDPLTGCFNRRYLADVRARLAADPDERCGALFIDIDHFKQYNDAHGHQAGDDVLVRMSRFLMRLVRAENPVVRVGGDEFVILLAHADDAATRVIAERLRQAALRDAPVPFSLGWAARTPRETLERMLSRADAELLAVRVLERTPDRRKE